MKKIFLTLLFFGFCFMLSAQTTPKVGDELVVKEPTAQNYRYIKFPKLNILVKRGKIANYKSVYNATVVVDDVMTKADGSTYVTLKKKDGSKFFGLKSTVKANYNKAIESKELSLTK
ncbi:hypothetical protein [uncultured Winogradskyella sp.]|uniref:hypothetical protein n=1 Tax=uncultured Winogradskyella sp. TaxID=395353 RepID=UPI0026346A41|nr:hypothetical protein [uncultured Winogradskyella sp.]